MALPAFIAGVAAAPALYLGLRFFDYERPICAVLAAAVVVSDVHIQQSGRVKSYTIDALLTLALAVVLPRLAAVKWRWPLALAWVLGALLLGSVSGTVMLGTIGAGVILVLHPRSDVFVRISALAAQVIALGVLYLAEARATNLVAIEDFMERAYDSRVSFHWNPIDFGAEILEHARQIARVYPGGSAAWLSVFALVAVAGLVLASLRGSSRKEAVAARFFLLLLTVAFVGGLAGRFPFGPTSGGFLASSSDGGRYGLWLVPVFAFGLGAALHRVRLLANGRQPAVLGFGLVLVVVAVAALVHGYDDAPRYPQSGSASATTYIKSAVRPRDVVIVAGGLVYSFAASANLPMTLRATPKHQIGYTPVFHDHRFRTFGEWSELAGTPDQVHAVLGDARRVLVYGSIYGSPAVTRVAHQLTVDGFRNRKPTSFGGVNWVVVWTR